MKKSLITILALCIAAMLILTACGQKTTEPVKEETTAAEQTTVGEETTVAEETTEDVAKEEASEEASEETTEAVKEETADDEEADVTEEIVEEAEEAAEDVLGSIEDKADEEASSISDFISSISESDIQEIFNLIADGIDNFANDGEPSQAGNIIRSLGNLVNTIITGGEVDADSSELVMDLIMDEDSLSQLSDGMILDMYLASRDELIGRGVIK